MLWILPRSILTCSETVVTLSAARLRRQAVPLCPEIRQDSCDKSYCRAPKTCHWHVFTVRHLTTNSHGIRHTPDSEQVYSNENVFKGIIIFAFWLDPGGHNFPLPIEQIEKFLHK